MKSDFLSLGVTIVVALLTGPLIPCEAADVCGPGIAFPSARYCAPQQRVQPSPQRVSVTVPVPVTPAAKPQMMSFGCQPSYCVPSTAATPSKPMPVRVDIAVRPEACDRGRTAPVVYRDPGFAAPIICHTAGLAGAVIAAPLRILEALCPVPAKTCPARHACMPDSNVIGCGYSPPPPVNCAAQYAASCRTPTPCVRRMVVCAPQGPSVSPLPTCAAPSQSCGPNLPPALVKEYEYPPLAPQDLLSGIWNLPRTLVNGRFAGDLGSASGGPPWRPVVPCAAAEFPY